MTIIVVIIISLSKAVLEGWMTLYEPPKRYRQYIY
jgi:hypothetical protein